MTLTRILLYLSSCPLYSERFARTIDSLDPSLYNLFDARQRRDQKKCVFFARTGMRSKVTAAITFASEVSNDSAKVATDSVRRATTLLLAIEQ